MMESGREAETEMSPSATSPHPGNLIQPSAKILGCIEGAPANAIPAR